MKFSLESYRSLLATALEAGFRPTTFTQGSWTDKTLLLRHDVDYSLEMAVELAKVNARLGVSGTFFILARAHSYNPRSRKSHERLAEIAALGQRLGVHVAGGADDIAADFDCLASVVPVEEVFCWHNPTPALVDEYRDNAVVAGLTNVYSKRFLDDALYRSDSNFDRSFEQLVAAFHGDAQVVHLLIHPINWVAGGDSMLEVFEHAWPYLIRESELEARTNRVYAASLPDGMPDALLADFARRWRQAAG